jgi:C4-dicarboxylate-specific signal transduction histidine kinase
MGARLAIVEGKQMSTYRFAWWPSPSAVLAYGVAIVSVTAALAVALLLDIYLQTMPSVSLLLCAIMFVAWFGGGGPSLLAVVLATLYFTYFSVDSGGSFDLATKDIPRVALFVVTSSFVVFLSVAQRRNAQEVARVNKALLAEIAERKRVEAYLDEAQALSRTGCFCLSIASCDVFWSKEGYRVLDIESNDKPTFDLLLRRVHPDDRFTLETELDRVRNGGRAIDHEVRWLTSNGSMKHLHIRAHRTTFDPDQAEVVVAVMDVSETRKAQETLQATQAALAHAARVATLGEMSASIAHEVNQPLAGIVTNGEAGLRWLSRKEPALGEVRGAMERMISDAKRTSEVVQRLRALARKAPAKRQPLDLNDVIDESIALLQHEIQNRHIILKTDLARSLPLVLADRIELQQLIINLMVNGMQAMEPVTDQPRCLFVRSSIEADQALVVVRDSGVGLAPGTAARLFTPFFTTRHDGMGLGLSICRSIAESHGGRIWASCNDGPGATFHFTLPLRLEEAA